MNKVILMGRLTRDPEVRYTQGTNGNQNAIARYSLAVNRSYKRDGEPDADFINCVAFGARGEFAAKYLKKGTMIAVVGELRTGSYTDKDGNKRYTTDVVVSEHHFTGSRADNGGNAAAAATVAQAAPAPASAAPAPAAAPVDPYAGFDMGDMDDGGDDLPF